MDLGGDGVLPLEADWLLGLDVGMFLYSLEYSGTQLGSELAKSSFILEGLDHNVFQIVHFSGRVLKNLNINTFYSMNYIKQINGN